MISTEDEGFLSPAMSEWISRCRKQYDAWFVLYKDTNRLAHGMLDRLKPHAEDPRESIVALFFLRVLSHSQGAVVVVERGMISQAEVLCRCALEALFALAAIKAEEDTATALILADRYHQLDLLKAARKQAELKEQAGKKSGDKADLSSGIAELEQDLKQNPSPRLTTKDLAERAGLLEMYYSAYKLLSLSVHSNLRDLEQQLGLDAEGHIQTIWWGPNPHGIDGILMAAAESLLRASALMADLFQIDGQNIKDLIDRFTELTKPLLDQPDETAT
jgi:hypothetical protein